MGLVLGVKRALHSTQKRVGRDGKLAYFFETKSGLRIGVSRGGPCSEREPGEGKSQILVVSGCGDEQAVYN